MHWVSCSHLLFWSSLACLPCITHVLGYHLFHCSLLCGTGAVRQSAAALSLFLDSLAASKHYAHMQHMRNQMLTSVNGKFAPTLLSNADVILVPASKQAADADQSLGSNLIPAVQPGQAPVTDSHTSSPAALHHHELSTAADFSGTTDQHSKLHTGSSGHEDFAAAYAADWACLIWLLQKAPGEVLESLRPKWQEHQAQEFALWVRPASELTAVRSKAAAKVGTYTCTAKQN